MPNYIGAYHMIGQDEYEPQRKTNFYLHIYGIEDTDTVTLCTSSVGGLSYGVGEIPVPYGNTKVKFAGLPDFDNVSLQFNDFIGKNTQEVLSRWFATVFNPQTQVIGKASNYKKEGLLTETAPDGTVARAWTLHGAWPKNFKVDDFEYGNDAQVKINMELVVDTMTPSWTLKK